MYHSLLITLCILKCISYSLLCASRITSCILPIISPSLKFDFHCLIQNPKLLSIDPDAGDIARQATVHLDYLADSEIAPWTASSTAPLRRVTAALPPSPDPATLLAVSSSRFRPGRVL